MNEKIKNAKQCRNDAISKSLLKLSRLRLIKKRRPDLSLSQIKALYERGVKIRDYPPARL